MRYMLDCLTIDVRENEEEVAEIAALIMASQLLQKPKSVFGLCWGNSPTITYRKFVEKGQREHFDHRLLTVVKGDEMLGLPMHSPLSGESYLHQHVLAPLKIASSRYVGFLSDPRDPEAECARVQSILDNLGQIDLMLLGIGQNGHLLFNERAYQLDLGVHTEKLDQSTLRSLHFPPGVTQGITCGLRNIRESRKVVVLACGLEKCATIARLVQDEISHNFSASMLRCWSNSILLVDKDAVSYIDLAKLKLMPSSS